MKQETKSELARQRILDAAMTEFSSKGYERASLNAACAENGISKGIVYHHFKDKNELYLLCVERCFRALTAYLEETVQTFSGTAEERLSGYFNARLRFFAQNPLYLGIFADATFRPPKELNREIAAKRVEFDRLNLSVLTSLLEGKNLRSGLSSIGIAEDFRMYMDYFNVRFWDALCQCDSPEQALHEHEKRCHQQISILLYGVFGE